MRIPREFKLTLSDDTFNALKVDFDKVLSRTLANMQEKGSEAAELKISLKIALSSAEESDIRIDDFDGTREVVIPRFDHKITSAIQIKDEASGTLGGNYELVFDKAFQAWVLREIISPQQTLQDYWEPEE